MIACTRAGASIGGVAGSFRCAGTFFTSAGSSIKAMMLATLRCQTVNAAAPTIVWLSSLLAAMGSGRNDMRWWSQTATGAFQG